MVNQNFRSKKKSKLIKRSKKLKKRNARLRKRNKRLKKRNEPNQPPNQPNQRKVILLVLQFGLVLNLTDLKND